MITMAQNAPQNDLDEDQIEQFAKMAAQQAPLPAGIPRMAAPVDPHATLTTPLGPPTPKVTGMAAASPDAAPSKMSLLKPQEDRMSQKLMADYKKDADPYGSPDNHPGLGGKILHGLSVFGNTLGDIVAPNLTSRIPGSNLHREVEEEGLQKNLQNLSKDESTESLQGAQAGNQTAEAGKSTEETKEMPGKAADEHALSGAQTGNLESQARDRDAAAANPSLATAYAHAVNQAIKEGRDPAQDPIVGHLSDAIVGLQPKQNAPAEAPKTITAIPAGQTKPHELAWDAKTGKYDLDQGEHYEKPITVNVGQERAAKNDVLKAYQPTLDSAERMNVMTDNAEKALKDHDQQAMLSLLTNHLGMTAGLQKGMRINQAMINEAAQSQPWLAGIKAKFDKDGYLSGVNLSPGQVHSMVDLARSRYGEDAKKSRATARYLGSQDDGPARMPGKATMNYYIHLAGGDPSKAKQLAGDDGWSVNNAAK